jgi:hypothetical protein
MAGARRRRLHRHLRPRREGGEPRDPPPRAAVRPGGGGPGARSAPEPARGRAAGGAPCRPPRGALELRPRRPGHGARQPGGNAPPARRRPRGARAPRGVGLVLVGLRGREGGARPRGAAPGPRALALRRDQARLRGPRPARARAWPGDDRPSPVHGLRAPPAPRHGPAPHVRGAVGRARVLPLRRWLPGPRPDARGRCGRGDPASDGGAGRGRALQRGRGPPDQPGRDDRGARGDRRQLDASAGGRRGRGRRGEDGRRQLACPPRAGMAPEGEPGAGARGAAGLGAGPQGADCAGVRGRRRSPRAGPDPPR